MRGIIVAKPSTPEWTEARKTGIGASQASAACGVSEYETPLHVYLRCRGELPEIEDNAAMRLGRRLEPIVVEEFVAASGIETEKYPVELLRHEQHPFVLATPDAWLKSQELLEAKTTTWMTAKKLGEEGSDAIPTSWLMQTQQQMAVTGAQRAHVAVLLDGRTLKAFIVERQEVLIERIIAIETELWQRIQDGVPPEPTWTHSRTPELIRQLHRDIDPGKVISLSDEARVAVTRRAELSEQKKALEAEDEMLKAKVAAEIGDAEAGDLGDGFVMRRKLIVKEPYMVSPKPYVDLRKMKKDSWMKG